MTKESFSREDVQRLLTEIAAEFERRDDQAHEQATGWRKQEGARAIARTAEQAARSYVYGEAGRYVKDRLNRLLEETR